MRRREILAGCAAATFAPGLLAAEPGVTDNEILLGMSGHLSGPPRTGISAVVAGANLAFAGARAQLQGRAVKLISLDDELRPEKAVANYDKLLNERKVLSMFLCGGSATTAAAGKVLQQTGSPMIAGYGVVDSAREKVKGHGYFMRATIGREAQVLVQHLTTIGITKIAVATFDNPGGLEASKLIETALEERKLKPHAVAAFKLDGSNVAAGAQRLAENQPQAVLMYIGNTLPGELIKATWALGSAPVFYGMSIVAGEVTVKVAGERARGLAISQVVPYPWGEVDPVVREYRHLAATADVPVGYYSFEGYLAGLLMIDVLKRAGKDLSRQRLHSVMKSLKARLAGMDLDFTQGHTGSRFVELVQVNREGKFIR